MSWTRLGPGTLYGAITSLERRGWIEPLAADERRRPYWTGDCARKIDDAPTICSGWTRTVGGHMSQSTELSFGVMIRRPSAFLPMAMSLAGLTLVLVHIALYVTVRETNEEPRHTYGNC